MSKNYDTADIVRPIVLRDHEVRAILDGRQTQIRRPMLQQPSDFTPGPNRHAPRHSAAYFDAYCGGNPRPLVTPANPRGMSDRWCWWTPDDRQGPDWIRCPFGAPGASLWVRETWTQVHPLQVAVGRDSIESGGGIPGPPPVAYRVVYRADGPVPPVYHTDSLEPPYRSLTSDGRSPELLMWRPSVHMPRWASRLTLRVTDVRVERIQSITEEDARAEGAIARARPGAAACHDGPPAPPSYVVGFREEWCHAYSNESWDANPWVWVVSFERAEVSRGD